MTQRVFLTEFWDKEFIQELSSGAKLLYIYCLTNTHCNQAGVYYLTKKTISEETGIDKEDLAGFFKELEPKVLWYPDINIIWARNFLKYQAQSPLFLKAAAKCLRNLKMNGIAQEVVDYNKRLGISIPYLNGYE